MAAALKCPHCGCEPIESGLFACRGCGATISYASIGFVDTIAPALLWLVVVILFYGLRLAPARVFREGGDLVLVILSLLVLLVSYIPWGIYLRAKRKRLEGLNIQQGVATFYRRS